MVIMSRTCALFILLCYTCKVAAFKSLLRSSRLQSSSISLRLAPLPLDVPAVLAADNPSQEEKLVRIADSNIQMNDRSLFGVSNDLYQRSANINDNVGMAYTLTLLLASDTSESSFTAEEAAKWFFLAYVVVSFAAGFKEFGTRFQTWLQNRDDK